MNEAILKAVEEKATELGMPKEEQQQILETIESADDGAVVPQRRLFLRRLKVEGRLVLDHEFRSGINLILSDDNFAGKSTMLNFVRYCFTGKSDLIDPDIEPQIDTILLEFQVDESTYTTRRTLRSRNNGIFGCTISDLEKKPDTGAIISNASKMKEFYLSLFEYPRLAKLHLRHTDLTKTSRPLGFGDYFRALYQDQDRGYSELFSEYVETRQHVLNVMLGAAHTRLSNRARIIHGELDNRVKIMEHQHAGLKAYFAHKLDAHQLPGKASDVIRKLQGAVAQLETAVTTARATAPQGLTVEEADRILERISREMAALLVRRGETEGRLEGARRARQDVELQLESAKDNAAVARLFGAYFPTQCPRCAQGIPHQRITAEETEGICRVCARPAPPDEDQQQAYSEQIADLEGDLEECAERIGALEKELRRLDAEVQRLDDEKSAELGNSPKTVLADLQKAFDELAAKETELARARATLDEIERDGAHIAAVEKEIHQMKNEIEVWKAVENAAIATEASGALANPYESFERHLAECLDHFKRAHKGRVELDPKGFLKIGSARFDQMRPGERIRVCIGVYYVLLKMALFEEGKLPRFLMIDSPRQQEMDLDDYRAVGRLFQQLAEAARAEFQVIIASASPEISFITSEDRILRIPKGERTLKPNPAMAAST